MVDTRPINPSKKTVNEKKINKSRKINGSLFISSPLSLLVKLMRLLLPIFDDFDNIVK
jgi:hypothetical protein